MRIMNKILFAGVLIGLLTFLGCDDINDESNIAPPRDIFEQTETDISDLSQDDRSDNSGYEWLTVYNDDGSMENIRVPVTEDESTRDDYQEPVVEMIKINGSREQLSSEVRGAQNIPILILGDGFTGSITEQALYNTKAVDALTHLASTYPFNLYSEYFTGYIMPFFSNESGVSRDYGKGGNANGPIVDNYFGSTFYHDGKTDRLLYVTNYNRVTNAIVSYKLQTGDTPALILVLANTNTYGGGGGAYAVASLNPSSFGQTVTHEMGHALGKLNDEYYWAAGAKEAPNMTKTSNKATVKWSSWIHPLYPTPGQTYDGIGIYHHAENPIWYRPSNNCHMRYLSDDFCAVCSAELIRLMANKTGKAGYLYTDLTGGNVVITGLTSSQSSSSMVSGKIIIPSRMGTKTVTEIGAGAFQNRTEISTVTIPATMTKIGANAFYNTGIWNSTINNNVIYINKWAVGYKGIINNASGALTLGSDTAGIGDNAFSQVSGLREAEIPRGVTNIGTGAFSSNPNFNRVWIPSTVTTVDSNAFANCTSLTIYAQATSKPVGWHTSWNPNNCPVIWNSQEAYTINFTSGSGTQSDPFIITTAVDLNNVRYCSDKYFELGNDINLQNTQWTPIPEFNGTFKGNNRTIKNLKIVYSSDKSRYGLFVNNYGSIYDLNVTANINFQNYTSTYVGFTNSVGVIAVDNYGTIDTCAVSASGSDPMIYCKTYFTGIVGGIVATNYGNINLCKNNGVIYSSGDTGGIAGHNRGTITNCENNALVCYTYTNDRNTKTHSIGGIAGINYDNMSYSSNKATILYGGYNQVNDNQLQPRMAHIAGSNYGTIYRFGVSNVSVNKGNLIIFSWTENGVTYTHDQAKYVRNTTVGLY